MRIAKPTDGPWILRAKKTKIERFGIYGGHANLIGGTYLYEPVGNATAPRTPSGVTSGKQRNPASRVKLPYGCTAYCVVLFFRYYHFDGFSVDLAIVGILSPDLCLEQNYIVTNSISNHQVLIKN